MRVLAWYLNIHTRKLLFTKNSTYKRGTSINKEFIKKKNVCGTNPNKCPFLSRFFV